MIYIKPNDKEPLQAHKTCSGMNGSRPWEWIKVKGSGKDRKTVTLWIENTPSGIEDGDWFRVKEIKDFKFKSKQDRNGVWQPEDSLTVVVEKAHGVPRCYKPEEWTPERVEQAKQEAQQFRDIPDDDMGLPF